jgi:predicted RND superfamily exporter protein
MVPPSHSRISRYHTWVTRRPAVVLIGALLIGVMATALASRLKLKTAFSELLPSDDPGVVALARTQKRLGDLSLLLVGIRSPDREANLRYAEALTRKLQALPPEVMNLATYHVRDVRDFFQRNKWLYVSEEDLEAIRDRLRTEISKRKNPLYVSLSGDDEESVESMRKRLSGKGGLDEKFPGGVFESKGEGGDYVWIAALPPGGMFVENAGEALLSAANELIASDPPSKYHPQMKVEPAGPIVTGIASRRAIENDILWVTVSCLTIVAISIGLYFRRWRSIPLTGAAAAMGTMMAFAVAQLAFGYLNSSTAFLGSIIIGNGINYAIVLMSRYEEHRARGDDPDEALRCALGGTWRGTLVASIAASAAYASLMVTSFRGFYQFGVMGATGVIFCWLATYSIVPAMLSWLDRPRDLRGWRGALWRTPPLVWCLAFFPALAAAGVAWWEATDKHAGLGLWQVQHLGRIYPRSTGAIVLVAAALVWTLPILTVVGRRILRLDPTGSMFRSVQARSPRPPLEFGPLARFIQRHAGLVTGAFAVLTVISVIGLRHFLKDPFEYDFRKLNAKLATTEDAKQFSKNLNDTFGRWPSPTILLADSVDEVEPMRAAIRRQDKATTDKVEVGQIVTIFDLLPGAPEVQRRKLEVLAQIRKLTHDPALVVLNEKEKADLAKIDPSPDLRELTPMDLPAIARRPFTEVDGTVGKVVLVYPPEKDISVWNGRDLLRIASVLQRINLDNGKVIETSGFAVVFGSMIRSVLKDGPIATVASLLAVIIIIIFTIRPAAAALMALATLGLGVLLMTGGAGLARVHVTFLNFIVLPITFGIGAEYAVNVVVRYREERDVARAVISTGAAVALCSWTTIVGYGSLLAASNQALNGFGLMAIIGEVVCLAAAIVALPAVLFWRHAKPFKEAARTANGAGVAQALGADREEPPSTAI